MSYQVIARKYRPQRFNEVVGQEHVTQTLVNAIQQNRIAHAYLLCGPRGTGKTTIARIFAKCLRCKNAPTTEPCNECQECRAINEGNSLDMLEFDAASHTQVDKIREIIIEHVKYTPAAGKVKMYLVDEVHMLSTSSFNALLKTLEEPPEHIIFLFATTEPEKLPATILSRCQRFDLRRIPAALIVRHLAHIAGREKVKIDYAALFAIARGADGAMRDAESALDQLISFCGEKIEETDVLSMFGLTAQGQILEMARATLAGEGESALRQLNELAKHGKDLGRLLSDLLNYFRNLLIYRVSRGDLNLLEVSEAEALSLAEQSSAVSADALARIMEVLTDAETRLRDAASKKISIEVALLKAIEARNATSLDVVLKQLGELREQNKTAAAPAPLHSSPSRPPAAHAQASSAAQPATSGERPPVISEAPKVTVSPKAAQTQEPQVPLDELWGKMIEAVGRASPFTRTYLMEAHPVSLANNVFTIGFDPEFEDHIGLVDNTRNHSLLQMKLQELGIADAQIKFVKAEAPADWAVRREQLMAKSSLASNSTTEKRSGRSPASASNAKTAAAPTTKEDFKNDPLIQKALEIFKGQIVEVRA
jgi:DNA polymerase-3 subunit gamma/tau